MKHTKGNNKTREKASILADAELIVICKHCGKQIGQVKLIGLSLICPLCGKPQNGQPHLKI
jgi:predicted amidophosphoribosyltransferase